MNYVMLFMLAVVAVMTVRSTFADRQVERLSDILYTQKNYALFFKELDSKKSERLIPKETRYVLRIDGYKARPDYVSLRKMFDEAEAQKFKKGTYLVILEKELPFRINVQDFERSKEVIKKIRAVYKTLPYAQKRVHEPVVKDCEYLYAIKAEKSGRYAEELEGLAQKAASKKKTDDNAVVGHYLIRAAQSYHLAGNDEKAREVLIQADQRLKRAPIHSDLSKILNAKTMKGLEDLKV